MKYRFFPHTADTIFEAYGATTEEAFSNAGLAVEEIMTDTKKVRPAVKKAITAEGEDMKALLYTFLEKLLILKDSQDLLFSKIDVKAIRRTAKGFALEASASGEKFDARRHEARTLVKAITYHDMAVGERKGKKYVHVLVDI
ncbi:MAG: archease [Candidatus Aenigmatarchaeota archaeon]